MKWQRFGKYFYSLMFLLILLLAVLTVMTSRGIPKAFRIFSIETGSMEPEIRQGSLVFVRPQSDYEPGSVITFTNQLNPSNPQEYTITHRLVEVMNDENGILYQTKGDANEVVDQLPVSKDRVIGEVVFTVPIIGKIIDFIQSREGFLLVVVLPSLFLIINESFVIREEIQKLLSKRKDRDKKLLDKESNLALLVILILLALSPVVISSSLSIFTNSRKIIHNLASTGRWGQNATPIMIETSQALTSAQLPDSGTSAITDEDGVDLETDKSIISDPIQLTEQIVSSTSSDSEVTGVESVATMLIQSLGSVEAENMDTVPVTTVEE